MGNLNYVTQSMIKDMIRHKRGELCGYVYHAKYITKKLPDRPSEAMSLGHYFEFMATGNLPRSGKPPEPQTYKSDPKKLLAKWQTALSQAKRFKEHCKEMDLEIIDVGGSDRNGVIVGNWDFKAKYRGEECVVDMKFSGLLENKWDDLGWYPESLPYRELHAIQANHYHIATGLPFYFWVFDSGSTFKSRLFKVEFTPKKLEQHEILAKTTLKSINLFERIGWNPVPEYNECFECFLKPHCMDALKAPEPMEIEFMEYKEMW